MKYFDEEKNSDKINGRQQMCMVVIYIYNRLPANVNSSCFYKLASD